MIKTILALAALLAATWLASPEPSCAQGMCNSTPCYGGCMNGCTCIQPGGPGTRGWCN